MLLIASSRPSAAAKTLPFSLARSPVALLDWCPSSIAPLQCCRHYPHGHQVYHLPVVMKLRRPKSSTTRPLSCVLRLRLRKVFRLCENFLRCPVLHRVVRVCLYASTRTLRPNYHTTSTLDRLRHHHGKDPRAMKHSQRCV